jgi:hypothetical protein
MLYSYMCAHRHLFTTQRTVMSAISAAAKRQPVERQAEPVFLSA